MLTSLRLEGFRSLRSLQLELRPLNILIGANGSGKSNLIAFFRLLHEMARGGLQEHVARTGPASSLLYRGPQATPQLELQLQFSDFDYQVGLCHAPDDTFVFTHERLALQSANCPRQAIELGKGHLEAAANARHTSQLLSCRFYHFSDAAAMRASSKVQSGLPLLPEAQNLAAVLYDLREHQSDYYSRILTTIRLVVPFLEDFVLEPRANDLALNWRERGSARLMGPSQLSDGTLRAIALVCLLLQPETNLPKMIVVDEPELGLHPYALAVIASLFDRASVHSQVLISTQSSSFLDHFEPENVIVAEHSLDGSCLRRLHPEQLEAWLERYSLGEIWQKSVFGGGPR